jgi:8-oxo-dGTP pyrophosphatase MutT (NUDIX family)
MSKDKQEPVVVGIGAIVVHNDFPNKILMVEEAESDHKIGKEKGMFSVPVGHLISGKPIEKELIREVREETGYQKVRIKGFLGGYLVKAALGLIYLMEVSGKGVEVSDATIKRSFWANPKDVLSNDIDRLRPGIKEILEDYLRSAKLLEKEVVRDCLER